MGKMPFREDIQGLRAIAVLLVLAYHGFLGIPGGFIGVDVFFVISGFLITAQLLPGPGNRAPRLLEFYGRRARRIVPLASLVIATTAAVSLMVAPPALYESIGFAGVAASTFTANIWFASQYLDYQGAQAVASPFLQYWSLGVEEQFYLLWPLLVVILLKRARRKLLVAVALAAAASFLACVVLTYMPAGQPWAMFMLPARLWELAAGGLLAIVWANRKAPSRALAEACSWTGLVLIGVSAALFTTEGYPGAEAAVPVAGTVLLLWFAPGTSVGRALSLRPLVAVGTVSFGLYLWHWPVLSLAGLWHGEQLSWLSALAALATAGALAVASYVLVEKPVRYWPALVVSPARSILTAGGCVVVAAVSSLLLVVYTASVSAASLEERSALKSPTPGQEAVGGGKLARFPWFGDCTAGRGESEPVPCVLTEGSAGRILLWGDSHARHWTPALLDIAEEMGLTLEVRFKEGCSTALVTLWDAWRNMPYEGCSQWRDNVLEEIRQNPPEVVVVASYPNYPVADRQVDRREQLTRGMAATLREVSAAGSRTILMGELPPLPQDLAPCFQLGYPQAPPCTVSEDSDGYTDINLTLRQLAQDSGALFFNVIPFACPDGICGVNRDGLVVYEDAEHVTESFALTLSADLEHALAGMLPAR